jgi:signal transduction histidine kinase
MIVLFLIAGLAVAAGAVAIGALVAGAPARELERVTADVEELRRSANGPRAPDLERPLVVTSHDEIGKLAAALGRLRVRLAPILAEHYEARERALSADRARDEFLQLVSVELRSPLDAIIACANELIADTARPLSPEQRDDVNTVIAASRQLTDLIDEVLDVSAIATGQVQLKLGEVDVGQVVTDVVKIQRPIVQKKAVELRLSVDSPSPTAHADERRLRQVVTNIVSNAVKFTDKGTIEVTVRTRRPRVEISVRDTGPGIPAEALPKLFREFVQIGSLKHRAHGTGLGLAICKRLVEAHGGDVWAESSPGEGSVFHVALPLAGPSRRAQDDTPMRVGARS